MKKRSREKVSKTKSSYSWPVAYRWMATGTLAVYTALGSRTVPIADAQEVRPVYSVGNPASTEESSLPARRFNIDAGALDSVIAAYQQASGVELRLSNDKIRNIASPGVKGLYTNEQALIKLLNDTGVTYRFTSGSSASLELKMATASVDVTADVSMLQTSSPKFSQPLRDVPQTINVVPRQVLDQQNATTLREALRNVAGISLAAGEGGAQGDNLTIRGFSARNDLFVDGMRDFGSYFRDPFNVEELQVLQGPASMIFGRGSTGGVVNQSTKTPQLNRFVSGGLTFGTDATRRAIVDINAPISKLGPGAAFRLNVMGNLNNVAGRDEVKNRRFGVAPTLSLGLGTPTRLTFSYLHQYGNDIPDYGLPWLFDRPVQVNRGNFYGMKDQDFLRTYVDMGTAKVEHDFNTHLTLRNQVRYANYGRDLRITVPSIANARPLVPLSQFRVNRRIIGVDSNETLLDNQTDLTSTFKTGWLRHTLVSGIEAARETSDPTRPAFPSPVSTTSLLNPNPSDTYAAPLNAGTRVSTTGVTIAAYALDRINFGRKWELTAGVRWDRFDANYRQLTSPVANLSRLDNKPTWRTALNYKPVGAGSIYFAAGTSFNPSAEALSLSTTTTNLAPEQNRNLEFGTKWDLGRQGRLSLRAALFRTEKMNARESDPNNPQLTVLAGNQRVNGIQAEIRGRVTRRWDVLAGYALLDSRLISSRFFPQSVGARLANTPRNTFNAWNNFRIPGRWDFGLGGNFVANRTASTTAPLDPTTRILKQAPSYWLFSASLSHPITEHIYIQANAYNLTNRYYYDQLHPGHIIPGPGRSAVVGFNFKF